ncbi:MAG TPA: Lrp/AsnC ligand binding domain-containing protein [Nitrososphaeraceae archaeon]|jgi:DNA-binding Lrp family transcriptional regulator
MDTKLDKIDLAIIRSLMKDGRKSFRQVSREIKSSTPTVESHFSKMKELGIIENVEPILNIDRIEGQVTSFIISIKTDPLKSVDIANRLSMIPEVRDVYLITGSYNVIVKVSIAKSHEHIEEFVRKKIATIDGIKSVSYQVITKTIKDSQSLQIEEGISIKMKCDYCENDILQEARSLEIGHQFKRHFCCNSCLTLYKQKYKGRIEAAAAAVKSK